MFNIYFVEVDGEKSKLFDDGATPLPIWEPHYCVLFQGEKRLSHHRTEKAPISYHLFHKINSSINFIDEIK